MPLPLLLCMTMFVCSVARAGQRQCNGGRSAGEAAGQIVGAEVPSMPSPSLAGKIMPSQAPNSAYTRAASRDYPRMVVHQESERQRRERAI